MKYVLFVTRALHNRVRALHLLALSTAVKLDRHRTNRLWGRVELAYAAKRDAAAAAATMVQEASRNVRAAQDAHDAACDRAYLAYKAAREEAHQLLPGYAVE